MRQIAYFIFSLYIISCSSKEIEEKRYPSGNLEYRVETEKGLWNGTMYTYYPDEILESEQEWKAGKKNGTSIGYYKNGKVKWEAHYHNDSLHGMYKNYFGGGKLESVGIYTNGKRSGKHKIYYEDGTLRETQLYDSVGRVMSFSKYDTLGKPILDERFAVFYPRKNTIRLGEAYQAEVRLSSRAYDENRMIVGSFDENYAVKDTVKILEAKDFVFYYDTIPQDTGIHFVRGHIHDIDHRGDSTIIDIIAFQQEFYVKP